jgi:hypothetical protein
MTETVSGENQGRVSLRYKIILYVAAWLLALLATAPGMLALAYLFPLGLVAVYDRHLANDGGWGVFIGCYVVYLVHAFFYFRSKTTTQTQILYAILIILLIANVSGCREMMQSH